MVRRQVLALTTDSGGAASGTLNLRGYVGSIRVTGFDGSADVTITGPGGRSILTVASVDAEETYYPRTPVHAIADGAAIVGGYGPILLCDDAVTVTIANGGNAQTGTVTIDMVDG